MVQLADLPDVCIENLSAAELAIVRQSSWAVRSDRGLEVLRYREGLAVLNHPDLEKGTTFQRRLDELGIKEGAIREYWDQMITTTEGEQRQHLRKPLAALFRSPQVVKLTKAIRDIVEDVLDGIEDPSHVDFMREVAWKIPARVYCHLVAAPLEHADYVAALSESTATPLLACDHSRRQEAIDAFFATRDFVSQHIGERKRQGDLGDDFTSLMIRQQLEGMLTEEELVLEGIAILLASVDNTAHQIGLTLSTLLEDSERWRAVCEDEVLIQRAFEEAMRLSPRMGTIFRQAVRDTTVEDVEVPEGSWVFVSIRSANRDEQVFHEPDAFRFDRPVKPALQFGGGNYSCVGQTLARLELREVVRALRDRFPGIALAGKNSRYETNAVTELTALPVKLR